MSIEMHPGIALWATRIALVFFFVQLGGSLYEHLVIDRVWPEHAALIQPDQGGVDRKLFWMPVHGVVSLALPIALWSAWRVPSARSWLLAAIGLYVGIRVWTFVYFIPEVMRFEASETVSVEAARRWVRFSMLRLPILLAATYASWRALAALDR